MSILRLRFCRNGETGERLDTGKERAVCFESPDMPSAWRLWCRLAEGRWQPESGWLWMDCAHPYAEGAK